MTPHELSLLRDIQDAGQQIRQRLLGRSYEHFADDRDLQLVVERLFTILGEAASRLERQFPDTASTITNLRGAVAFRNFLIHVYDKVDPKKVWDIAEVDLPAILLEIERLLNTSSDSTS